jgi:hypothetical protein
MFRMYQGSSLTMEAVRTSETSVDNHFTRQYNPEDSSERPQISYTVIVGQYGFCLQTLPHSFQSEFASCEPVAQSVLLFRHSFYMSTVTRHLLFCLLPFSINLRFVLKPFRLKDK